MTHTVLGGRCHHSSTCSTWFSLLILFFFLFSSFFSFIFSFFLSFAFFLILYLTSLLPFSHCFSFILKGLSSKTNSMEAAATSSFPFLMRDFWWEERSQRWRQWLQQ